MQKIRTIFTGTPEFAAYFLKSLLSSDVFEIVGVITQSDKPSGRNQEITVSPVKQLALDNGIKIFQPQKLKEDSGIVEELSKLSPDLMIVVAYGQIIPKSILEIPKHGSINVHPSLLPKYRGASPVQSAILNGEIKTGVTIMQMDEKMDHGPILAQIEHDLSEDETNYDLHLKLADTSQQFLLDTALKFIKGEIKPIEQDHAQATFCKTITKEDARIDWSKTAQEIKRKIYAFYPWPGTWTTLENKRLKIFPPAEAIETLKPGIKAGQIIIDDGEVFVACGDGFLQIKKIQLEGKKETTAKEFLNGNHDIAGKLLN